ncbi:MAG: hypothetical protein ACTSRZ_16620 [Promethearchaeota archaeon]
MEEKVDVGIYYKTFPSSSKVDLVKNYKKHCLELVKEWIEDDFEDSKDDELIDVKNKKIKDFDKKTLEWMEPYSYFHKWIIEKLQSKKEHLNKTLEKLQWEDIEKYIDEFIKLEVIFLGDDEEIEEIDELDFDEEMDTYMYCVAFRHENEQGTTLSISHNFLRALDLIFEDKEFDSEEEALKWVVEQESDYAYAVKLKDPKSKSKWKWLVAGYFIDTD